MKKALESAGASAIRRHQSTLIAEIAIAFPVTIALWLGVYYFLPPFGGMEELLARLVFALKCCCIAILFCFLTGIEAVVPGLFALAFYCADGHAMRAVVSTTVVWIAARFAFWIGYHYGSQHRAIGAPGMMQSMLVLLYVCARIGYEIAGPAGAIAPLIVFGCVEAVLVRATRPVSA
jgi:hypothetical protein